jgi:hypothetical protein
MCVRPDELVFGTSYAVDRLPYAHAPDRARGRARRSAATAAAAKIGRVDRLRGPRRRAGRGGGPGRHDRRAAQDRRSAAGHSCARRRRRHRAPLAATYTISRSMAFVATYRTRSAIRSVVRDTGFGTSTAWSPGSDCHQRHGAAARPCSSSRSPGERGRWQGPPRAKPCPPVGEHAGDLVAARRHGPGSEVFDQLVVADGIEVDGRLRDGHHNACSTGPVCGGSMAYMRVGSEVEQVALRRQPWSDRTGRMRPVANSRSSSRGFA